MLGLREEIERLHLVQAVSGGGEKREITHLRGRIAGDIDDALRGKGEELLQKLCATTRTRRVDDDDRVAPSVWHLGEDLTRISRDELAVREVIDLRIVRRFFDSTFRKLHANDFLKFPGRADAKQSAAFVRRALVDAYRQVADLGVNELLDRRYDRLQSYGRFTDTKAAAR